MKVLYLGKEKQFKIANLIIYNNFNRFETFLSFYRKQRMPVLFDTQI